uniref:BHLH domain-containing protein n=1 Tax=Macrostomum lignano TaxID=282301 RepID=A0A1I8FLU9_9PLAT
SAADRPVSVGQILANHSAVINSFDQETLDQAVAKSTVNKSWSDRTAPPEDHLPTRELRCIVEIRRLRRRLGRRRQQKGTPAEHRRELLEALPGRCGAARSPAPAGILTAVGRYAAGSLSKAVRSSRMRRSFCLFLLDGMHEDLNRRRRSTGKAFESSLASLEVNSVESTAPGQQQHQEDLEASLALE